MYPQGLNPYKDTDNSKNSQKRDLEKTLTNVSISLTSEFLRIHVFIS